MQSINKVKTALLVTTLSLTWGIWIAITPAAWATVQVIDPNQFLSVEDVTTLQEYASSPEYRPLIYIEPQLVQDYASRGQELLEQNTATDVITWFPKQRHVELTSPSLSQGQRQSIINEVLPLMKQGEARKALEKALVSLETEHRNGPAKSFLSEDQAFWILILALVIIVILIAIFFGKGSGGGSGGNYIFFSSDSGSSGGWGGDSGSSGGDY